MQDIDSEIGGLSFMLELDDYLRARAIDAFRKVSERKEISGGTLLFSADDTTSDDGYIVYSGNAVIEHDDRVTGVDDITRSSNTTTARRRPSCPRRCSAR